MVISANWIWLETEEKEGLFARARKTFDLDSIPKVAEIAITCSGHYQLYVNGRYAGRGPAHSMKHRKKYDVLHIADLLQLGRNVLAVKLVHYGYSQAHSPDAPGGFLCQLEAVGACIVTDETWKLALDLCFDRDACRRNGCYGPVEIYDAREEDSWLEPSYDDGHWPDAILYRDDSGKVGSTPAPWTELVPRVIQQCVEENTMPDSVVRVAEVLNQEFHRSMPSAASQLPNYLLLDVPEEPRYSNVAGIENVLRDDDSFATITQPSPFDHSTHEQYCATVIVDFGRELTGYGWIDVEGNEGAIVDVAYAERITAGRVPAVVQGVGYADRYILREGRQRHQVYDWKGYRYLQLTFRDLSRPLKLHAVGTTFTSYPVESGGAFHCSDARLERIWEIGAYTQQLCTHDRMMDCPWREQQEWLGDGRVQLLILQNAFGSRLMTENFIRNFAESQFEDGRIPAVSCRETFIVDYALWWIRGVLDVHLLNNDPGLVRDMLPHTDRLLGWFAQFRDNDGLLDEVPGWLFIDWANLGKDGKSAALNATYCIALEAGIALAETADRQDLAGRWSSWLEPLKSNYHDMFWSAGRSMYVDNVVNGEQDLHFSQHTQSITVVAGLCVVDAKELMLRTVEDASLVQTEPYFSFYLCEALGIVGLAERGRDFILERWGAMLDRGAASFWEEWQVEGTFREGRWLPRPRSHCHAWSAAPTAWLSRYVLGIRVDEIGGPIVVAPQPCGLAEGSGKVPTVYGKVTVTWDTEGGKCRILVEIPGEVPYTLGTHNGVDINVAVIRATS